MAADSAAPTTALTPDDDSDRTSGLRLLRLTAVFVTVGYAAYGVVAVPVVAESTGVMDTWWTVSALIIVFGPGIALGVVGWRARTADRLQRLARTAVGGFALTMATWWFGWSGEVVNATTGIWFSMFFGVVGLASTLAFQARYAFATLAVFALGCTAINHEVRPPELNQALVPDAAWAIGFSLVFVAAGAMVVRTATLMDDSREVAYEAGSQIAAAEARTAERARFDALTHDSVMATLLMAARHGASTELAGHARATLLAIDAAASGDHWGEIGQNDAVARIRDAVLSAAPSATFRIAHDSQPCSYPGRVVDSMSAAAAEAVHNSLHHAGDAARIQIDVAASPDSMSIRVVDDGVGFDPTTVPPTRFGLAVSIRGRMARLNGGACSIDSVPGGGTRIDLEWEQ